VTLNHGYAYREQLSARAAGLTTLEYLTRFYTHSSELEWNERLGRGEVLLEGRVSDGLEVLKAGQALVWNRGPWREPEAPSSFEVLYEDDILLAVNKPSGLPTLPGGGFLNHTLLGLVRATYPEASPLHRLGRATSGLVLFARTSAAASSLSQAWRDHEVAKQYRALSSGVAAQNEYDITAPIGSVSHPRLGSVHAFSLSGKASHSIARTLERRTSSTLFQVDILTGRPHQIRIHLAYIGHPLEGDPLYTAGGLPQPLLPGLPGDAGYLLHAYRLAFKHPSSREILRLEASLPAALELTESSSALTRERSPESRL